MGAAAAWDPPQTAQAGVTWPAALHRGNWLVKVASAAVRDVGGIPGAGVWQVLSTAVWLAPGAQCILRAYLCLPVLQALS